MNVLEFPVGCRMMGQVCKVVSTSVERLETDLGIEGVVEHVVVTEPLGGVDPGQPQPVARPGVDVDGVGLSVVTHPVGAQSADGHGGLVVSPGLILHRTSLRNTEMSFLTVHLICSVAKCQFRNPDNLLLLGYKETYKQ